MPSNYTQNYQLNQWEADDRVLRTDFNADNARLDAALKAEADARAAVNGRVDGLAGSKADVSALNALKTVVNGKGDCRIVSGSYTGTGTFGSEGPSSLTFPFPPKAVFVAGQNGTAVLIRDAPKCFLFTGQTYAVWNMTWSGGRVAWYVFQWSNSNGAGRTPDAESQMNILGKVYHYTAFG